MNEMSEIINLNLHPLISSDVYLNDCKQKLKKDSILKLDKFLSKDSLKRIQNEAHSLHSKAYYCSQNHTVLLNEIDKKKDLNDPCNIEVKSDKGCVPHDLVPSDSDLIRLYYSQEFMSFLENVLEVEKIYPYTDSLSSINYNYYEKNQQ